VSFYVSTEPIPGCNNANILIVVPSLVPGIEVNAYTRSGTAISAAPMIIDSGQRPNFTDLLSIEIYMDGFDSVSLYGFTIRVASDKSVVLNLLDLNENIIANHVVSN
jgi:hypothetical protein